MTSPAVTKSTNWRGHRTGPQHGRTPSLDVSYVCPQCAHEIEDFGRERGLINQRQNVMSERCDRCRFLKYVNRVGECWLWTGTRYGSKGNPTYGCFWLDKRRMGAHRASYLLHHGPILDDLDVLHACDTPSCVAPAHLSTGTHSQNLREARTRHGEWSPYGENHGRARLTWAKVDAIRAAAAAGAKHVDLAAQYGCTAVNISHIVRGKRWVGRGVREAVA